VKGEAVSSTVGAIVLISVAVLAMGIVILFLFSTPLPTNVPAFQAIVSNESMVVYISHEGGDTLQVGQFRILVDGTDRTSNFTQSLTGPFSLGKVMKANLTYYPKRLVIVFNASGAAEIPLLSADLHGSAPFTPPGWYSSAWLFRKKITIKGSQVTGSHTDFPVLIYLVDGDLQFDALAGGNDILFTSWDGTTKLPHELEFFNKQSGSLTAWVKVPSLTSGVDTVIYMYYDNPGASNQQDPANVWSNGYVGVWHLNETGSGAAGEFKDSTSHDLDGQGGEGEGSYVPTRTTGKIASGQTFSNDLIDCGNNSLLDVPGNQLTLEAWVKHSVSGATPYGILNHKGWWNGYSIWMQGDPSICGGGRTNCIQFNLPGDSYIYALITTGTLSSGTWHHVAGTYDGTIMKVYIDSAVDVTTIAKSNSLTAPSPPENDMWIGHGDQPKGVAWSAPWDGQLDEIRISNLGRSASWIATEYNNQNSPSTFITISTEQSPLTMS
jgi:Concanavalin A-like lectin/glucanases superfamily/Domain of unknown function (DUF2341)/Archaeal Type IV pilin, N-terminal